MRAFLCLLFDLFGEPGAVAAQGSLGRRNRALMLPWLRAGEAFLRRLLFIEALALVKAPSRRACPPKRAARSRIRRLFHFHPDKPEDWRVSFRMFSRKRSLRRSGRAHRACFKATPLPAFLCASQKRQETILWRTPALAQPSSAPSQSGPQNAPRNIAGAWPLAERLEAMLRVYNDPHGAARRLARIFVREEGRALRVLRPEPQHVANIFGAQTFARCNALVASRRRKWERLTRADSG